MIQLYTTTFSFTVFFPSFSLPHFHAFYIVIIRSLAYFFSLPLLPLPVYEAFWYGFPRLPRVFFHCVYVPLEYVVDLIPPLYVSYGSIDNLFLLVFGSLCGCHVRFLLCLSLFVIVVLLYVSSTFVTLGYRISVVYQERDWDSVFIDYEGIISCFHDSVWSCCGSHKLVVCIIFDVSKVFINKCSHWCSDHENFASLSKSRLLPCRPGIVLLVPSLCCLQSSASRYAFPCNSM